MSDGLDLPADERRNGKGAELGGFDSDLQVRRVDLAAFEGAAQQADHRGGKFSVHGLPPAMAKISPSQYSGFVSPSASNRRYSSHVWCSRRTVLTLLS
jgi:hypothetical protein